MVKKAVMEEGAFMCSICGAIVHEDANVCYQCSAPLEGSFRAAICAACGSIVASDRELCSVCGVEVSGVVGSKKVPVLDKDILGIVDEIRGESTSARAGSKVETVVATGIPGDTTMELMDGLKEMNRVWEQIESAIAKGDLAKAKAILEKGGGTLDALIDIPARLDVMMQSKVAKSPDGGGGEEARKKQEYADRRMEEVRREIERIEKEKVQVRERTAVLDSREKSLGERERAVAERESKGAPSPVSLPGLDRHRKILKQILMFNQTLKSPDGAKNVNALTKAVQELELLLPKEGEIAAGAATDPDSRLAARERDLEAREKMLAAERERLAGKEDELREADRKGSADAAVANSRVLEMEHELSSTKVELERVQGMLGEFRGLQDARQKSKETEELLETELKSRVTQVRELESRVLDAEQRHEADRSRLEGEAQSLRQELGFAKERQARITEDLEAAQAELMKSRAREQESASRGSADQGRDKQVDELRRKLATMTEALGLPAGAEPDGETVHSRLSPLEEAQMKQVLKALDDLLGRLPDAEIDGFANSVVFPLYEKLTERYDI
ncbi:MAG TPA: zinc ribbon domain-containing protein [Thermoplasmata archaeon]|nr:zinc ribbon domain-containing protein [Thermoplasmata archaeon]